MSCVCGVNITFSSSLPDVPRISPGLPALSGRMRLCPIARSRLTPYQARQTSGPRFTLPLRLAPLPTATALPPLRISTTFHVGRVGLKDGHLTHFCRFVQRAFRAAILFLPRRHPMHCISTDVCLYSAGKQHLIPSLYLPFTLASERHSPQPPAGTKLFGIDHDCQNRQAQQAAFWRQAPPGEFPALPVLRTPAMAPHRWLVPRTLLCLHGHFGASHFQRRSRTATLLAPLPTASSTGGR